MGMLIAELAVPHCEGLRFYSTVRFARSSVALSLHVGQTNGRLIYIRTLVVESTNRRVHVVYSLELLLISIQTIVVFLNQWTRVVLEPFMWCI